MPYSVRKLSIPYTTFDRFVLREWETHIPTDSAQLLDLPLLELMLPVSVEPFYRRKTGGTIAEGDGTAQIPG